MRRRQYHSQRHNDNNRGNDDDDDNKNNNNSSENMKPTSRYCVVIVLSMFISLVIFLTFSSGYNTIIMSRSGPQDTTTMLQLRHTAGKTKEVEKEEKKKNTRRIIAVGDIHGDKDALIRALELAKLVVVNNDTSSRWTGGTDILVQIGDLLNSNEGRDLEVLLYVVDLEKQAREAGGGIIIILGDHDIHNAVSLWKQTNRNGQPFPSWFRAGFSVDNTLFVHGSLTSSALKNGGGTLNGMNQAIEAWINKRGKKPDWVGQKDGPIWSRLYSDKASDATPHCEELQQLLEGLSVNRMVVGHTVRAEGISSLCDGKVWRIDVGLSRTESRAGKIGACEVLEIRNGGDVIGVLSTNVKLKTWK